MNEEFNTDFCFTKGKITTLLDGGAGSSGKGKLGSFICSHANNWQFALNAFMPQAGHWCVLDDGRKFFYQTFNACAHQVDKYEKLYIGPGACIELAAFWREVEENKIPRNKIGIHPLVSILRDADSAYERGVMTFDGKETTQLQDGTMKHGSTAHGCGANRARRVLRRQEALYARDVTSLSEFICDTSEEIMIRLDHDQSGLLEIAQGFQLSYLLPQFFPNTTSRNCTVAAGFDDMMLPIKYAANVILNFRTAPIRIASNKYLDPKTGKHLTWADMQDYEKAGKEIKVYRGNSGPGWSDQLETSWEEITKSSGSKVPIFEITSVTKLPRRVFTFSKENLRQAIRYNDTGGNIFLSVNFMNYVSADMLGCRGNRNLLDEKSQQWIRKNIQPFELFLKFIGTGPKDDDMILYK